MSGRGVRGSPPSTVSRFWVPGPKVAGEVAGESVTSVTRGLGTRSTNGRRVRARPIVAEHVGARNSTWGAVLREIMRLDRNFWVRRVWVDLTKTSC